MARRIKKKRGGALRGVFRVASNRWWLLAAAAAALAVSLVAVFLLSQVILPDAVAPPQSSKVLASDGKLIATLHSEEDRTLVPLSEIAIPLREAVVATEDRSFFKHSGVSFRGIMRAIFVNVRGGGVVQGGSTITQQYVRNAFTEVGRERTVFRKVREVVMAVKIERRYSKDKILEFYLNTVYFGRGAYGAEAAARTYFKKASKDLTRPEAAFLAGAIRAPEKYQPDTNLKAADSVRKQVLDDMRAAGYLSKEEAASAKQEVPEFNLGKPEGEKTERAAFFVEYVRRHLKQEFKFTDREILTGGLQIHTTLNLKMQDAAEQAILSTLDRPEDPEAALVSMDPEGRVLAMVGGRDVTNKERALQFNFAYQKGGARGGRQAGSAFKPFTLATFLSEGYSPESKFDGPSKITIPSDQCKDQKGQVWEPSNFENESFEDITVVDATVKSVNTVYAQMVDLVQAKKVRDLTEKIGDWDLPPNCSLALGTEPVTPLEMSRAFATLAARGKRPDVLAVTKVVSSGGRVLAERHPRSEEVLETKVADQVNRILLEVVKRGTGRGAAIGREAAGKTGTTQNHVDAWFVGHTPDLITAVWMGFPPKDGKIPEMKAVRGREVTGGSFPATIWKKFMTAALKGSKALTFPQAAFDGKVLAPSPEPCPSGSVHSPLPTGASPGTQPQCVPVSPAPGSPGQDKKETPTPSPATSPTPTPKPSSPSPGPSSSP